ncbi:MAG: 16S rRNA (adenine(1518)-N(6)/adenine(1519)-N(6))-dimethyltransferase RsmA [Candidatus Omnitrophota bacterium]
MLKDKIFGLIKKYGLRPKKRLGQNFLISDIAANVIIDAAGIDRDEIVVEIGAGLGSLTMFLLPQAARVVAVEKDERLSLALKNEYGSFYTLKIITDDFLDVSLEKLLNGQRVKKVKIVGNIPYYITAPIIIAIINQCRHIKSGVLTLQEDVAQRLVAGAGSRNYSRISCLAQYFLDLEIIDKIAANEFFPAPKVDSKIIRFTVREKPRVFPKDEQLFFAIIKAGFSQRRKMLINTLGRCIPNVDKDGLKKMLELSCIENHLRAEQLTLEDFARLSDTVVDFDFARLR